VSTIVAVSRESRFEDLPELLTAREAAALLGCSPWTIYQHVQRKTIPHRKIGKLIYVPRSFFDPAKVVEPVEELACEAR
jgi:excisionase family DNA binding protein